MHINIQAMQKLAGRDVLSCGCWARGVVVHAMQQCRLSEGERKGGPSDDRRTLADRPNEQRVIGHVQRSTSTRKDSPAVHELRRHVITSVTADTLLANIILSLT